MITIQSPDTNVRVQLTADHGRLHYAVTFRGHPVLEPSPMRFTVDGIDLAEDVEIIAQEPYQVDETYPCRGAHSHAINRCSGITLSLRPPTPSPRPRERA